MLQLSHSLRECRRGMARRHRPFAGLRFAHVYVMCVCDVCLGGVSWIVVGEATVRMSSKCNRDMRGGTVGMLSIRETPWSA